MPYDEEHPPLVEPDEELNALATAVIGAAIEVHQHYGPGLDESLYEGALCVELRRRNIAFVRQPMIEVAYKGEVIGERRLDLIVGGRLVVELKAVDEISKLHKAQVLTYLKITGKNLGLLINFNSILLRDGIRRIIRS